MADTPLMQHATAAWLVENTGLTFPQIAEFCDIHILEVQAIADGTAGTKYTGRDPVRANELTMEEIERGQADPSYRLQLQKIEEPIRRTRGPRYTPVSKRQDKPNGIAWLLKNHPEISDGAVSKLIGTTRNTINAVRDRTHWNSNDLAPKDPVTLGLCSQRELDAVVTKAARKAGLVSEDNSDARLDSEREALIEQLRAEREQAAAEAEAQALAEAQAQAEAEAHGAVEAKETAPAN